VADSIKRAWDEVGEGFADLGRRLSENFKKLGPSQSTEEDQEKVREALRTLSDQVDRALTSVGDTFRDPGAKEGMQRVVRSFGIALSTSFSEVSDEVRRHFDRRAEPQGGKPAGGEDGGEEAQAQEGQNP